MKRTKANSQPAAAAVRCAIYTRKSTEEGLDQAFNSLDAQREAGEAYIRSQSGEGWTVLPTRYDDGGFTGGNTDRPALRKLLRDIEAGLVDAVVVYKVDRLSRSLLDFAQLMQTFEKHRVAFVSVTQQFNTGSSMGRLCLNVLLSFAQFEREIIGERTRDKIAMTRRKGKWAGGHPVLGYDVDPKNLKLEVNEPEAERVRTIFKLYLEHGSLLPVVQELIRRNWGTKAWTTRKGQERGGRPFTRTNLYKLLTNVTYAGRVRHRAETHPGEHAAIVDDGVWRKVQTRLARNGRTGGGSVRTNSEAILQGLLRCTACDAAMTPTYTAKKGTKRYRYYVCTAAQKKGWATCPAKSVSAHAIESLVVQQIRGIGNDEALRGQVAGAFRHRQEARRDQFDDERRQVEADLRAWHAEVRGLSSQLRPGDENSSLLARLADLHDRIGAAENRLRALRDQLDAAAADALSDADVATALSAFDPVWGVLTAKEQARVLGLLVDRVGYDGARGKLAITFRPSGIATLANDLSAKRTEQPA